ncbi:MAG: amidase family protein [Alphaproteobacteria bacterium]|nr:amidase family protein [Alphaproteobacteria bacterium]
MSRVGSYRCWLVPVLLSFCAPAAWSQEKPAAYIVEETPLAQISHDLSMGKVSAIAITKAYIDRIKTYDGQLHSVTRIAPDALAQAAASDKRRKAGHAVGPLDGVPIMLKDNIDAVGMATTAGSYALIDNVPARDAELVRRLRAAGAVMLGKANLSQWAGLRTTRGFAGSTVGGTPHNPYDLTRSAAGSSSGPGIIAAASLAAGAVGSDTTGSIWGPANVNGVVGLRPTVGLVSRHGIVPISSTLDTAGPMARTVKDAAMMLTVMAGTDPADPATKDADAHKSNYAGKLETGALKGRRIGVIRGFSGYADNTRPVFDNALAVLKAQGAELVEISMDGFADLGIEVRQIEAYDFKPDLAAYLKAAPTAVKTRTLADVMQFNSVDEREKLHSQDRMESAAALSRGADPEYARLVQSAKTKAGKDGYGKAMKNYHVDALVVLAGGPAGVIKPDESDPVVGLASRPAGARQLSASGLVALAGYPDLVVPAGFVDGVPVGISFIGMPWSEAALISYGYAYEQASQARKPPQAYKTH